MSLSRISSRFPSIVSAQCRTSIVTSSRHHPLPVPSNQFHSLGESHYKVVGGQVSQFHHSLPNAYAFQRFGFSSVPSPKNPKKEKFPLGDGRNTVENSGAKGKASGDAEAPQQREAAPVSEAPIQDQSKQENNTAPLVTTSSRWNPTPEQLQALEDMYEGGTHTPTADQIKLIAGELRQFKVEGKNVFYWFKNHRARERQKRRCEHRESLESEVPDSLKELTMEDLVKLVTEKVEPLREKHEEIEKMQHTCADMVKLVTQKEELLKGKHKEIEKMQDKVLRTCADMVNVAEKARDSLKKLTMEVLVKLVIEKVELLKGKHEEIEKMQHTCADMVKLVTQKEVLLKGKHKEIEKMQDKVLRTCANMVNVANKARLGSQYARQEAEYAKKEAHRARVKSMARIHHVYACMFACYLVEYKKMIPSRFPRIVSAQCRNSIVTSSRHHPLPVPYNQFHSLGESHYKVVGGQVSQFHHSLPNAYAFQRFGFSSVPSPKNPKKEKSPPLGDGGNIVENSCATAKASEDAEAPQQREAPVSEAPIQDQSKQENNTAPLVTTSSRWKPTPEQLQALEDMYEGGTHTPTADQIKLIAGELRRFGKIEGKNVFYWFKTQRARERQKRRREHRESLESQVPGS
ncbi:hypothetical protein RHSIM_Rhsim04G0016800 [Rhododendron simsii]|uniref:Homeobox domain-containing protein n=1 Tax=Rhododendron simsii TaxID=118357 RepID=A0A834H5P2_RHOSS|nr:hypothetical protein RHSIM_Rhsim04G0016800 [Rhododendron simsii]